MPQQQHWAPEIQKKKINKKIKKSLFLEKPILDM